MQARIIPAIVSGGVLAGLTGLILAGSMRADVTTLKSSAERDRVKAVEIAEAVATLGAQVKNLDTRLVVQRREAREDAAELGRKLDRVLERLPK